MHLSVVRVGSNAVRRRLTMTAVRGMCVSIECVFTTRGNRGLGKKNPGLRELFSGDQRDSRGPDIIL